MSLSSEGCKRPIKIMQEALKNVPIDQWAEAITGLNELLLFDGEGNILKVDIVDSSSELYISVEKNGKYDSNLTSKAYNEYNAQQWEAVSQNALELATGVATFFAGLGITGLDLTGTYFSGGTLAATGITQAGLAVGGSTALAGAGAVADSISKIRTASSSVSFSFANNYNQQVNNLNNEKASGADFGDTIKKGEKMPDHKILEKGGLPKDGKPNSSADILNSDGSVKQRRYYDDQGRAKEDIDFNHSDDGTHEFPHRHKWDWTDPEKPKRLK